MTPEAYECWYQERCGILEFDAGKTREQAEAQARAEIEAHKAAEKVAA